MSTSEYNAAHTRTDLCERDIVYVETPEQAHAALIHAQRRVHAFLNELEATFAGNKAVYDRLTQLDNAVCDLEAAYHGLVAARLMATIVAVNEADHDVYVMPAGGAS